MAKTPDVNPLTLKVRLCQALGIDAERVLNVTLLLPAGAVPRVVIERYVVDGKEAARLWDWEGGGQNL